MNSKQTYTSAISGKEFPAKETVLLKSLRNSILNLIKQDHPTLDTNERIAIAELNIYREKYISKYLQSEINQLSDLEKSVITSMSEDKSIVNKVTDKVEARTFGQRIADNVADFGGSWTFIIAFLAFILLWICANIILLLNNGFDPYPFILLNLILSCIAALQAPVIMMSQNRQEEKDRERAKQDYMINLKSELEIRLLHEKIDHLIMHQQEELIEIQKVQIEMMNDILERIKK
jgi:uncharacterized membrane protein